MGDGDETKDGGELNESLLTKRMDSVLLILKSDGAIETPVLRAGSVFGKTRYMGDEKIKKNIYKIKRKFDELVYPSLS